jgi:ribosomal-protein-alanine acetyltransferase
MRIETAKLEHLQRLAAIERQCFSDPWPEQIIVRMLDQFTVCIDGDALAGYIVLSSVLDEGSIDNVAVAPEFRRQGVADLLLSDAESRGRAMRLASLTLEVRAGNEPAIRLYEKHGFAKVGRRKSYYEKPREDAILMTLLLSDTAR